VPSNSRGKARRRRCNIDKQEKIVTLLWTLAQEAQREPKIGCVISLENGTRMSDHVLRKALAAVMDTFGYDVLEVQ